MERGPHQPSDLLNWVESVAPNLYSIAKECHEKFGRGVIFIEESNFNGKKEFDALYLTGRHALEKASHEEFISDLKNYDPNTNALILISSNEGNTLYVNLEQQPHSFTDN